MRTPEQLREDPYNVAHLMAAINALQAAATALADKTATERANIPFPVHQVTSQIPNTNPFTLYLPPLSQIVTRLRGFLVSYPGTISTARLTIPFIDRPNLIIDFSSTVPILFTATDTVGHIRGGASTIGSEVPSLALTGSGLTNSTVYATLWMWGEQIPALGMVT